MPTLFFELKVIKLKQYYVILTIAWKEYFDEFIKKKEYFDVGQLSTMSSLTCLLDILMVLLLPLLLPFLLLSNESVYAFVCFSFLDEYIIQLVNLFTVMRCLIWKSYALNFSMTKRCGRVFFFFLIGSCGRVYTVTKTKIRKNIFVHEGFLFVYLWDRCFETWSITNALLRGRFV